MRIISPPKPNEYRAKKNAQEAHEAIRPTSLELDPESVKKYLKDEQYKLYKLIWDRFLASQMSPAVYNQTGVDIEATVTAKGAAHRSYGLRASGRVLKFGGWLEAYGKGIESQLSGQAQLAGEDENNEEPAADGASANGAAGAAAAVNAKKRFRSKKRKRPRSLSSAKERS